ncbi:MAG: hypothetical protein IPH84_18300 [Bacteroidales bacterium]|nr:hypothetical protein [Bacteroidales bacterium]
MSQALTPWPSLPPTGYNSTVTSMVPVAYVFKWTISNGVCTPSESTVTITNYYSYYASSRC